MKLLLLADRKTDLGEVLESCGADVTRVPLNEGVNIDIKAFDVYAVIGGGKVLDPRLRVCLEEETEKGKRLFTQGLNSWGGIYSEEPIDTTRSRIVVLTSEIPGLERGELLDDGSNRMMRPWFDVPGQKILLKYGEHIVAHRKTDADTVSLSEKSAPAMWLLGENVLMCSFELHNFNRARFAPRKPWQSLISFIVEWLTGCKPTAFPENVVKHNFYEDFSDDAVFDLARKNAISRGVEWLKRNLNDSGFGGIKEGLRHNIDPDGIQTEANTVRTDCCGEAAGAFRFFGELFDESESSKIAERLTDFVFGPMTVKGGLLDGMLRWTDTGWQVCYQDDVARAILPELYNCIYLGNRERIPEICKVLDFLLKTTAKDGCRVMRTDAPELTQEKITALAQAEHGLHSAHYNAYYHAALLLGYKCTGDERYLDAGKRGLETLMSCYPDTCREQSETEEMCRLILPLSVLYDITKDEKHKQMLYRVTDDLSAHRHPCGGYLEWDTGYKAKCSRESDGECSLLTQNGDPVADLLYSVNWLPAGFAFAYKATGDLHFKHLWRGIVGFFLKTQVCSDDMMTDGSWCRAFDMELGEVYACPHDVGWAAKCSESGWTNAEILMGMMLPEIFEKNR